MSFFRSRYAIVLWIAVAAIIWAGVMGRGDARADQVPASGGDPLSVSMVDDDPEDLRSELIELQSRWNRDGGLLGYPFWEQAYREWRRGVMAGSMFKHYTVSYRQMLERCAEDVRGTSPDTDGARRVRGILLESLAARVNAMNMLEQAVNREFAVDSDGGDERQTTLEQDRILAIDELQRSYAFAREAMNTAQRQLDLLQAERIPEDSFL